MQIRKVVMVYARDSERVPFRVHREQAAAMLKDKLATVEADHGGLVFAIRLTGNKAINTARPGSIGTHVEYLESGRIHQHNQTWERELSRAA